jgi:hypothetical protein
MNKQAMLSSTLALIGLIPTQVGDQIDAPRSQDAKGFDRGCDRFIDILWSVRGSM